MSKSSLTSKLGDRIRKLLDRYATTSSARDWTHDVQQKENFLSDEITINGRPKAARTSTHQPSYETRYRDLERTCRNLRRGFVVVTLLCVCVVVLLVFPWSSSSKGTTMPGESQIDGERIPIESVTFERDDRFSGPSSQETDENWGKLMPPGDGFILVPNPSQYPTLQPGSTSSHHNTEEDHADIYDVSLFHQIHCLTHVRTYLYTMQASLNQTNPHSTYEILLKPQEDHVEHCFDYLRQALMCAGDVTLEWPREEADGRRFAVDGWGVEHQCKSWDAIMSYMMEHTVARQF